MRACRTLSERELAIVCGGYQPTQADIDCLQAGEASKRAFRAGNKDEHARLAAEEDRVCAASPLAQSVAATARQAGVGPLVTFRIPPAP